MSACLTIVCLASPAAAQFPFRVSVAGGWTFPVEPSDITDVYGGSYALAVGLHFRTAEQLGVWGEIGYYRHEFDTDAFEAAISDLFPGVNVDGNDIYIVPITAGVEYSLNAWGNTRPYVTGGVGFYQVSVTDPSASGPNAGNVDFPDATDNGFGIQVGAGVRTLVTPTLTLFLDATYHRAWISPDPLGFVPVRIGLRF
jgi:opacity protein-like surface antigen